MNQSHWEESNFFTLEITASSSLGIQSVTFGISLAVLTNVAVAGSMCRPPHNTAQHWCSHEPSA